MIKDFFKDIKAIIFTIIYIGLGLVYGLINKPHGTVNNLTTTLDRKIPFIKYFVIPYHLWYVFIISSLIYVYTINKKQYYFFINSLSITIIICYVIFLVFQTHVSRPIITGNDLFSNIVKWTYKNDNPYNAFPSIHVLTTELAFLYTFYNSKNKISISCSFIMSLLIILSTLFIKQHVLADIIGSTILALSCFLIINKTFTINLKKRIYSFKI